MVADRKLRMEWIDPKVINWDPELNTFKPEHGYDDVVDVIQLPDGTYEGTFGKMVCEEAINLRTPQVQCLVRQGTHVDVVFANLSTAAQQPLSDPLATVEAVGHAYWVMRFNFEEIMASTKRSQRWVEDKLVIYDASPAVKEFLGDGTLRIGHAVLLGNIEGWGAQEKMFHRLRTYGWTVKQLEEEIRGGSDAFF